MTTLARPTDESVSHFVRGWSTAGSGHRGLDYGWKTKAPVPVKAAADGVVSFMQYGFPDNGNGAGNGWGNYVKIGHGAGIETGYAHLAQGTIVVDEGQRVKAGQVIAMMGNSGKSGGRHLHFELWINGTRVDPEPYRSRDLPGLAAPAPAGGSAPLSQLQRRFAADWTFRRAEPSSQSAKVVTDGKDGVAKGEIGNFTHWTHGENVLGSDIWLKGVSGGWFHSSGLIDGTDVRGLTEIVPATPQLQPHQRVVRVGTLNERREPNTASEVLRTFKEGEVLDFKGWTRGQSVTVEGVTSDIWYIGAYSGTAFTATGFTSSGTEGLPEIVTPTPATPTPAPVLDLAFKSFQADTPLATWIGSPNYNFRGPRPKDQGPRHITLHWFGNSTVLADTDAHFQRYSKLTSGRGDGTASNYAVGSGQVHQYIREQDYQQADGHTESNRYGISIEHEAGPGRSATEETLALSSKLMADIARRNGWKKLEWMVNVFPHNHWVATQCPGTLPVGELIARANALLVTTVPNPTQPTTVEVDRSWLQSVFDKIKTLLGK